MALKSVEMLNQDTRLREVVTTLSKEQVKVASGRTVLVFNISGNAFRLIAAMHFNRGLVFALAFISHAEYSKDRWKDTL